MPLTTIARQLWTRFWLRHSQFGGDYGRLKALYVVNDPWELESAREQERFAETNALIRTLAPECQSLLELGCGEGFQTRHLLQVSKEVVGIEVSAQAVERAQRSCSEATFIVGQAEDVRKLAGNRRFDLATAFEILYYAKDIDRILADLQEIAPQILVSNFAARAEKMAAHFVGPGWSRLDDLAAAGTVWHVYWWRAEAQGSPIID